METKEYAQFTDQELLDEAKKMKTFSIYNALIIGFLIGIIFLVLYQLKKLLLRFLPIHYGRKF